MLNDNYIHTIFIFYKFTDGLELANFFYLDVKAQVAVTNCVVDAENCDLC